MEFGVSLSEAPSQRRSRDECGTTPVPGTIDSGELLRGQNEIRISHGGAVYSLRQTRQGKLILTK